MSDSAGTCKRGQPRRSPGVERCGRYWNLEEWLGVADQKSEKTDTIEAKAITWFSERSPGSGSGRSRKMVSERQVPGCRPYQLNQKLMGVSPRLCVLTSPTNNSNTGSSLRTMAV